MRELLKKRIACFISVVMLLCVLVSVEAEGAQQYKFTRVDTDYALSWQSYFNSGMHLVHKSFGDFYYVTKEGKLVKPHPNLLYRSYSDGLTPIYDKNKGLGYVDTNGKVVIPMSLPAVTNEEGEVVYVGYFVDGYALVYKGTGYDGNPYQQELWYTIDKTGKKVDVELSTDTLAILDLGYPHNSVWETVNINGEDVTVFFNEGLALAGTNQGAEIWVIEKLNQTAPKPEEPKEKPAQPYTNLSNLSLTSWQLWDSGTTLNYKITNSTDKVDRGAYAVIICGSGYDSTKVRGTEDYMTSRFANSDYYPIEGHIFEYTAQPKETIRDYIWSQIGGEVGVAEEDLGKGDLKYIVIKLKSEEEKSQLQAELDSLGLGTFNWFNREENTVLQNWLRQNFGLTKGGNKSEK